MTDPIADLSANPAGFDLLLTLRRLEHDNPSKPRIGNSSTLRDDYVTIRQDPFLAFPDANIVKARTSPAGRLELFVQFMGLLGPQGALPLATTEEAYRYLLANDDAFARFLDIFNNRFIQLFYRGWAQSRPIAHRDRPLDDRFERYVGAGIGLGLESLRDLDSAPDLAKTGYAGLMAAQAKSASRLCTLLSGLFGLEIEVEEFVGCRLLFDESERSRLGQAFASLGKDMLLGAGVYSVQDKIRVRVFAMTLKDYRDLLPSGNRSRQLADMVFFYLGATIEWDVELVLPVGEVEPMRLGRSGQLGWTSWMAPNWSTDKGAVRADARFDLSKRFSEPSATQRSRRKAA